MLIAISEIKGYPLDDCSFVRNSSLLKPGDMRKIKEIECNHRIKIVCALFNWPTYKCLGKEIVGKGNNTGARIGTLEPIKELFYSINAFRGKILIGKVELNIESKNYLSFYGINKDFNYIYKEE